MQATLKAELKFISLPCASYWSCFNIGKSIAKLNVKQRYWVGGDIKAVRNRFGLRQGASLCLATKLSAAAALQMGCKLLQYNAIGLGPIQCIATRCNIIQSNAMEKMHHANLKLGGHWSSSLKSSPPKPSQFISTKIISTYFSPLLMFD